MKKLASTIISTCLIAAPSTVVFAHDSNGSGSSSGGSSSGHAATVPDALANARVLIASKQWQAAIAELQHINATKDANWNNLMGYSYRKADPPDLVTAEKYYSAALEINPKHLGTLEYLGEMRLQQGDLAGAEKQLATLKNATFLKSDEFKDLQVAIESYKAADNKYVSTE